MKTVTIAPERIIQWMNVIRSYQHDSSKQYRILENFWESQIKSKVWLVENLCNTNTKNFSNVYIFGGWYGILSQMIVDTYPHVKVFSIDQDPECTAIGAALCNHDSRINFITEKMENFSDYSDDSLVINTSVEHVNQKILDTWYRKIPNNTVIALQSNNYFDCDEHVNCVDTLEEFYAPFILMNVRMTGSLDCKQFTRFMIIGVK
jgi:trans-aconitate methyltransferase